MTESLPSSLFSLLNQLDREGVSGYEKYVRVRRYIQFKAREQRVPVCGTFELTPLCNLACSMCYVRLDRAQMGPRELLPVDTWRGIIDQAVDAGLMYASVTGGECLTYEGFRALYLHLRARGIETVVLTNGVLLDEDTVRFLADHPPAGIQITLYGADEDEYERVTGRRVFRTVMDNLARLKAQNLPTVLSVTPNRGMKKPKELMRLLYELGLPYQINSALKTPREETGRPLREAALETYLDIYREEQRLWGDQPLRTVPDEDLPDPGRHPDSGNAVPEKGVQCAAGRSSFCVTWDGKLKPCNTFPGIEADVRQLGFQAAWAQISRQVQEVPLPVECPGCPFERICNHCIIEHLDGGQPGHVNPAVCGHVRCLVKEGVLRL